jgi:hypothetical protein
MIGSALLGMGGRSCVMEVGLPVRMPFPVSSTSTVGMRFFAVFVGLNVRAWGDSGAW